MSFQDGFSNYSMGHVAPLQPRKQGPGPSQPREWRQSGVPPESPERGPSGSRARPTRHPQRPSQDYGYSQASSSSSSSQALQNPAVHQSSRLARAVQQRPSSQLSFASVSEDMDDENSRGHSSRRHTFEQDDEVEESEEPAAPAPKSMKNVLAALNDAGKRQRTQQQAQQASKARARRTGVSDQGESARMKRLQQELPAGPAFRAIERVLGQIAQDWPMLLPTDDVDDTPLGTNPDDDYNPVPLALALLDPASIDQSGSRLNDFLQVKEDLGEALKSHIQSHYRAFDASVSAYNSVVANLKAAQKQVHGLKGGIGDVTKVLGSKREELASMVQRRDELSEMSRILDTIDQLKDVPDRLETLLSEKRFLNAVVLLSKSLKTINKAELLDISALIELRAYLHSQESAVYDILVEELHNHLYLKSFYCEGRWKPYTRGQTDLPVIEATDEDLSTSKRAPSRGTSKLHSFLQALAEKPSVDPILSGHLDLGSELGPITEEARPPSPNPSVAPPSPTLSVQGTREPTARSQDRLNPELDSFAYIETLFESLAVLGKLPDAVEGIAHRIPVEVFTLVDATVDEVDERNIDSRRRLSMLPQTISGGGSANIPLFAFNGSPKPDAPTGQVPNAALPTSLASLATVAASNPRSSLLRLNATQTSALALSAETLRDLFWTLYSKLDAVLQGFRVGYEVCVRIGERRNFSSAATQSSASASAANVILSLVEIWKPIQAEVRLMLHEYLTEDEEGTTSSRHPVASVNDVLRGNKSARDPSKSLFKYADSEAKSSRLLKSHEEELTKSLKASVPGLVSAVGEGTAALSAVVSSDNADASAAQHRGIHRILTTPDPFNVSVLFGPTLAFVDRIKQILPGNLAGEDERGFSAFLDDFVANTYLPMLEDKVMNVFLQAVSGADAFAEDTSFRRQEQAPLVKCVLNVFMLISSLCGMLWSTPFHRESYSRLIINVIEQFLVKWHERFNDLVSKDSHDQLPGSASFSSSRGQNPAQTAKRAAVWARDPVLYPILYRLLSGTPSDDPSVPSADLFEELNMNLQLKSTWPITDEDIIASPKKLTALGSMHESLRWFTSHMRTLRHGDATQGEAAADDSQAPLGTLKITPGFSALPLTPDMASRFDTLIEHLQSMADVALFTLRCDLRLRVLSGLDRMALQNYVLIEKPNDPDGFVADLNGQLAECDECLASTLEAKERNNVLVGLPTLIDQLLISNARQIKCTNENGGEKLYRNVLALQQNLKNLGDIPLHVNLDRSKQYFGLLRLASPKKFAQKVANEQTWPFSRTESKALLALLCGVDKNGEIVDGVQSSQPEVYQELLPQLPLNEE